MNSTEKMIRLYIKATEQTARERDRQDEIVLGILAGEEGTQIFGKPVQFTLTWPEGRPFGYTEEKLRDMAADWLRELRARIAA